MESRPPNPDQLVLFEVSNNTTAVYAKTPQLRRALDIATSYLSLAGVQNRALGWRPPEADIGEAYWDGVVHLGKWHERGPSYFPTGLLESVVDTTRRWGFWTQITDRRERPEPGVPDRGELELRPYQAQAVRSAVASGYGVIEAPPRAGKTRIGMELQRHISRNFAWVAPTDNIVTQTLAAFDEQFGKNYAVQAVGTKNWRDLAAAPVVLFTAATARVMPAEFWKSRWGLMVDEVHHGAADSYHGFLQHCGHVFHRYGMTGTYARSGTDELALWAFLSKTVFKITSTELCQQGWLVPARVAFLPVVGPKARGAGYDRARSGIYCHDHRNALAAWAASVLSAKGRRPLVLVGTKEQGRAIVEHLRGQVASDSRHPYKGVEFVSTDRPRETCRAIIRDFVEHEAIKILVGTSMVGEGTDLPAADSLVYAMGGSAEVGHRQASYRPCTAVPGSGKRLAIIVDFADQQHEKLLDHSRERLNTYVSEPTFFTEVLEDAATFPAWVDWVSRLG